MNRATFALGAGAVAFAPVAAPSSTLETALGRIASASSGTLGVYARKMGTLDAIAYNANVVFPAASTIKLCVLVCLYQYSERHPHAFDERRTLRRDDFVGGSEILDSYNIGDTITIRKLAYAMIRQSDNTASNVLISYLGFDRIAHTIAAAGLRHTQLLRHFMDFGAIVRHSENLTTPRDMGSLMYQIERGAHEAVYTVASPRSCRAMIDILLGQEDRDKIARGLPKGTPLANKTGEVDSVRNDVAIVDPFGNAPYVLSVYTKDLDDFSLGNIAIRRVAKAVNAVYR